MRKNKSCLRMRMSMAAAAMSALASFAADPVVWDGSTNLTMTANTTVDVPTGTTNVIDTLAGAYTLTKTGGGVLEVRYSKSASAKFVVSEGLLRFANPRPDDLFARAYFHVDASDLSSMTIETVNGTNFVTRWNDTDGRTNRWATHCTTVWNCRTDPEKRKPFLRMNFQNGLPVMDFGSLLTKYNTNEVGQALGYGAAMKFDRTTPYIKEGFSVFSDTEDYDEWPNVPSFSGSMNGMSIFSHETSYRFTRHSFSGTGVYLGLLNDNGQNNDYFATGKSVWFDGSLLASHPKWTRPSMGFHILRIRPTADGNTTFNSFAAEYNSTSDYSYGGQRIAEYVLFTNRTETGESAMTTDEAWALNRYLRVKWFPQTIAAVTVAKGASLDVDESANLTILDFTDDGAENLALAAATDSLLCALSSTGAHIHLDAAEASTLELVEEGGTNFVTRWNDAEGGTRYAWPETLEGRYGHRPDAEKRRPFINPSLKQNGLPIVDLGTALLSNYTNELGVGYGYGGALAYSTVGLREYIAVISENEETKNLPSKLDPPSYVAYYSGNSWSGQNAGRRGQTAKGKNAPMFKDYNADSDSFRLGVNLVNNIQVAYNYSPPDGFLVINLRPTKAVNCNRIGRTLRTDTSMCHDTYGGQRIAEYMVFNSQLADEKRQRIYNALRTKWFGDAPGTTNIYNNLSLGAGAAMTVKYEVLAVTNKLALAGSLVAPSAFAANVDVTGTNATIDSSLTIPDGAALSFARQDDGAWAALSAKSLVAEGAVRVVLAAESEKGLGGTSARLLATETPIASIDGWSLEWSGKHAANLSLREDGVWVEFASPGAVILLR